VYAQGALAARWVEAAWCAWPSPSPALSLALP